MTVTDKALELVARNGWRATEPMARKMAAELLEARQMPAVPTPSPLVDALRALQYSIATDPRDWARWPRDAWLFGIVCGWTNPDDPDDTDALYEIAARHPNINIGHMNRHHAAIAAALGPSMLDTPTRTCEPLARIDQVGAVSQRTGAYAVPPT